MSATPPASPELVRLKKQAVKRFHPDSAIDSPAGLSSGGDPQG
jgi:hypothetical protein